MSCSHRQHIWLPEIRKKILYLDQFFFSHAFKERDRRFTDAAQLVREKSERQLLVAPYSSVHEDETRQWRGHSGRDHEDLMEFIKSASRGHEFSPSYEIEKAQIAKAFQAFLNDDPPTYALEERDAIRGDIHTWDDYFRIDVGGHFKDIELTRILKEQSVEQLVDLFETWRTSKTTFEEDAAIEMRDAAKSYVEAYVTRLERLANGDFSAVIDSPVRSMVCEALVHCFPDEVPKEDRFRQIKDFFASPHFMNCPHQSVSCRMFAVLKEMVKRGAYRNREKARRRLSGIFQDIEHISIYGPYCDAFVVDQPMAELVSVPQLRLASEYHVKIFSLNNWDELLAWLHELEERMSEQHRRGLHAAYA